MMDERRKKIKTTDPGKDNLKLCPTINFFILVRRLKHLREG